MRIGLFILLILALGFSGCKTDDDTYDTGDYFGENELCDIIGAEFVADFLNVFHQKPMALEAVENGQSVYRFLILEPHRPIHLIRVETRPNGTAKVSIQQTRSGYERTGRKQVVKRKSFNPTKAEVAAFLGEMSTSNFWQQDKAAQYELRDLFPWNPPFFIFEGHSKNDDVSYCDHNPVLRKNTAKIASAFYTIARLDAEDEWTRVGYFSELLAVDWTFPEE